MLTGTSRSNSKQERRFWTVFIQVWKKEFSPCEGELAALRRGEEWDPVKDKLEKEEKEWRDKLELERSRTLNKVPIFNLVLQLMKTH